MMCRKILLFLCKRCQSVKDSREESIKEERERMCFVFSIISAYLQDNSIWPRSMSLVLLFLFFFFFHACLLYQCNLIVLLAVFCFFLGGSPFIFWLFAFVPLCLYLIHPILHSIVCYLFFIISRLNCPYWLFWRITGFNLYCCVSCNNICIQTKNYLFCLLNFSFLTGLINDIIIFK